MTDMNRKELLESIATDIKALANDEPIFEYTCENAVDDGTFVHPFPDKFPWVLFTLSIHDAIEQAIAGSERTYAQAAIPLIQDAVMIARKGPRDEYLWSKGLEGNVTGGDVWITLNDKGGLTLMRPSDW
jgi:hypothetical protein